MAGNVITTRIISPSKRLGKPVLEGKIRYGLKQYKEAEAKFRAVLDKHSEGKYADEAQYLMARSFFDEGNYDQAYREFENVKSEDNMILVKVGYFGTLSLKIMGRNQEALENYKKFVEKFPDNIFSSAVYYDMGNIQTRMKIWVHSWLWVLIMQDLLTNLQAQPRYIGMLQRVKMLLEQLVRPILGHLLVATQQVQIPSHLDG